jgi:hypothetical protein
MLQLNVNLTTLAAILWLGMLIISGSIWVLASQVRKVADVLHGLEDRIGRNAMASHHHAQRRLEAGHALPRLDIQARLDEIYATDAN